LGFFGKPLHSGHLPLLWLNERDTVSSQAKGGPQAFVQFHQTFVFKKAQRVFSSTRPELISEFYSKRLQSTSNRARPAPARTDHNDKALPARSA
jgi:hypothetical protein